MTVTNFINNNNNDLLLDPVVKVTLSSSNLQRTISYWKDILNMKIYEQSDNHVVFGYDDHQAKLEFKYIGNQLIILKIIKYLIGKLILK